MSHTSSATVASKTPYRVRQPRARSRLSNGTCGMVLPGIDQRSAIARRYRDVMCAIIADLGGESRLSEARLQLIRRFSALVVQAETMEAALVDGKPFDSSAHAHISSTLVRLCRPQTVRLRTSRHPCTTISRARSPRERLPSECARHHSRRSR